MSVMLTQTKSLKKKAMLVRRNDDGDNSREIGFYVIDWLESCDVLEGSTDKVYGNWFGFIVMDRDIDSGSTAIVKHSKRVDLALRECRADPIINKNSPTFNTNSLNSTNNLRQSQTVQHLYVGYTRYTDSRQLTPKTWGELTRWKCFLRPQFPISKDLVPSQTKRIPYKEGTALRLESACWLLEMMSGSDANGGWWWVTCDVERLVKKVGCDWNLGCWWSDRAERASDRTLGKMNKGWREWTIYFNPPDSISSLHAVSGNKGCRSWLSSCKDTAFGKLYTTSPEPDGRLYKVWISQLRERDRISPT